MATKLVFILLVGVFLQDALSERNVNQRFKKVSRKGLNSYSRPNEGEPKVVFFVNKETSDKPNKANIIYVTVPSGYDSSEEEEDYYPSEPHYPPAYPSHPPWSPAPRPPAPHPPVPHSPAPYPPAPHSPAQHPPAPRPSGPRPPAPNPPAPHYPSYQHIFPIPVLVPYPGWTGNPPPPYIPGGSSHPRPPQGHWGQKPNPFDNAPIGSLLVSGTPTTYNGDDNINVLANPSDEDDDDDDDIEQFPVRPAAPLPINRRKPQPSRKPRPGKKPTTTKPVVAVEGTDDVIDDLDVNRKKKPRPSRKPRPTRPTTQKPGVQVVDNASAPVAAVLPENTMSPAVSVVQGATISDDETLENRKKRPRPSRKPRPTQKPTTEKPAVQEVDSAVEPDDLPLNTDAPEETTEAPGLVEVSDDESLENRRKKPKPSRKPRPSQKPTPSPPNPISEASVAEEPTKEPAKEESVSKKPEQMVTVDPARPDNVSSSSTDLQSPEEAAAAQDTRYSLANWMQLNMGSKPKPSEKPEVMTEDKDSAEDLGPDRELIVVQRKGKPMRIRLAHKNRNAWRRLHPSKHDWKRSFSGVKRADYFVLV